MAKDKSFIVDVFAVNVKDSWWSPIVGEQDSVVLNFCAAVNSPVEDNVLLSKIYADCNLFKIGTYNCQIGKLKSITPVLVKSGITAKLNYCNDQQVEVKDEISQS